VYGAGILDRASDIRSGDAEIPGPAEIIILGGEYDILELSRWRPEIDQVLSLPGTVFTDLDESSNRLRIGIESSEFQDRVEAFVANSGVPLQAVIIEVVDPIFYLKDLRDKFRPVQGGTQIEIDTAVFGYTHCTVGFNAIFNNLRGFITNSHCTGSLDGGVQGKMFHQPTDPFNPFADQNILGFEHFDPEMWSGGICPSGRICRRSDAAFIWYASRFGFPQNFSIENPNLYGSGIARTTSWTGSLTIDDANPKFDIVSEGFPLYGEFVDKVGRTTGWTFGRITETCVHSNVKDTDNTMLCQYRVLRDVGDNLISDHGDSGSPVFRWLDFDSSDVELYGILWGGNASGSQFVFSSMLFIHLDLFPVTVDDLP
jgi:hypothetical protein